MIGQLMYQLNCIGGLVMFYINSKAYSDEYRCGLQKVQFKEALNQQIKKWEFGRQFKTDSTCHDFIKHSQYLRNHIQQLSAAISNTRKIFNTSKHKQSKDALLLRPLREVETLQTYFKFCNHDFDAKVRGFSDPALVLQEAWLVEKIFVMDASLTRDEILFFINMLECFRTSRKMSHRTFEGEPDFIWPCFIDDLALLEDRDMPALYFYISMVWNSMLFSQQDLMATTSKIFQPWRLSPKHYMSMDFVECLSVFNQSKHTVESKYVVGRVLPIRWPNVKQVETFNGNELQESNVLANFTYGQFIQFDCIKMFTQEVNWVIEYLPQILAKGGIKQEWSLPGIKAVHTTHLHKTWDELCLQEDPSQHYYKIFAKETMIYQNAFQKPLNTIRECVEYDESRSKLLQSIWVSNQRMNAVKFLGKEISAYKFDGNQWMLEEREALTMTSAFTIVDQNETDQNQKLVEKLSDDKVSNKLLTILDQIPNLKIKLSAQQQVVVQSGCNLLCLGRSGTGKTTSSVLRLFSQEVMFILLQKQAKLSKKDIPEGEKSVKLQLTAADLMKPCNMKTVFISASPVLVNEVSRFYHRLKESLVNHLLQKETKSETISAQHKEIMQLAQIEAELLEEELASQSHHDIPNAFENLKPSHFPLFVTVKQLLYMFDASLDYSFFARDSKNNLIGMDSNLSWHNENKGLYMINSEHKSQTDFDQLLLKYGQELVDEQEEAIEVLETQQEPTGKDYRESWNNRYKTDANDNTAYYIYRGQQLCFEVTFEVFESKFYSRFSQHQKFKRLSSSMVWTEIFSVIKGGLNSRDHYQGFLTGKSYVRQHASPFLTKRERQTVYFIFIEYERWKKQEQAFDLMDLVNHVASSGKANSMYYAHLMRMDYLMVDEVQDLTPTTLQLLLKLTKQQVYFAGDTAQTIAKGVGARFSDLKTQMQLFNTKVIQLTTNYRSHGQILALANSVVSLLEVLFPFSIDALAKEVSETTGMKPLILMPLPAHELRRFFIGSKGESQRITTGLSAQKPQFGCNQVVIVREQHQKQQLPDFLQSMLCLTVYEAKGLEFDDVILYNFFNSGQIATGHWKFINEIHFEDADDLDNQMDQIVQGLENMIVSQNAADVEPVKSRKDNRRMINKNSIDRSIVYRKFASLCIELKQLYVAITRPKLRLVIYDDDAQSRLPVQRVWQHLKVADIVTTTQLEQKQLPVDLQQLFETEHGALGGSESKPEEWKIQGIKFYKKKQFDQAIKCFKYAEEPQLMAKCFAYKMADAGNAKIAEAETIVWRLKTLQSQKNNKTERKQLMRDQKTLRVAARKEFDIAGDSFYKCGMKSQAASCYFTARQLNKAAEIFEELGQFGQAGECLMRSSKVDSSRILQAAEMFEKAGLIQRAIECYERIEAWERLLQCLHESKAAFKQADREQLANKYIPIALNKLYSMMMGLEKVQEANQGVLAEIKIKEKYKQEDAIQEEEDEQYFSEDDDEEEKSEKADSTPVQKQTEQEGAVIENAENVDKSFDMFASEEEDDILEDVFDLKKKKSQQVNEEDRSPENSFEILDATENGQDVPSEYEHLSHYDPDDEFLQSQSSYALLNSILQNKTVDQQSEYSIIESDMDIISVDSSIVSTQSRSVRFIKSQRKVADEVIKKIIYYISLFSEEVKGALSKLGRTTQVESEIDLASIKPEFLDLMLNILEHYDLIKLCLILCNKFKLTSRLGRYIVSSCFKYQSLQQIRFTPSVLALQVDSPSNRKLRQQSMIAHEALHNVYGLVEPAYLSLKSHDTHLSPDNSLGIENFQCMFGLGFWKKLVYIMNVQLGIDLCYKFCDLYNFNCLAEKCEQDYSAQRKMLKLRSVAVICARLWAPKVASVKQFKDICLQVRQEVQMNQLESSLVSDYIEIVQFAKIPNVTSQPQLLAINLLGQQQHLLEQAAQQKRDEELLQSAVSQGMKTIGKVFGQVENTEEQNFLAYTLLAFNCNLSELPLQSLTTLKAIYNSVQYEQLYGSLNMVSLDGVLYDNYKNFLMVSVHSQLAEDIEVFQSQSLRLSFETEYIAKATKIVQTQFRKATKVSEIKQLRYFLERNHKALQLQDFCSQKPQQSCAFVIDMDLQYLLVPKDWVQSIVSDRLTQFTKQLNRVWTNQVLNNLGHNLSPLELIDTWSPIMHHYLQDSNFQTSSVSAKLREENVKLSNVISQLPDKAVKLLYPTNSMPMKQPAEIKAKQQVVDLISQLHGLLSRYPVPQTIQVPGHASVFSFFTQIQSTPAAMFTQTGLLFISKITSRQSKLQDAQNTGQTNDYLEMALDLLTVSGELPLFIDELSQHLKHQPSLQTKHTLTGFRLLAYSRLLKSQVQDAINTYLQANSFLAPYINPLKNALMLQKSFYSLAALLCPKITIPCYAMSYIAPQFDYKLIDEAKIADAEYNQHKAEDDFEEEYYDEWDRPTIEDVKQRQLAKRPSAQVQETKTLLQYGCVLPAIDVVKGQSQMKDVLKRFVDLIADLNLNGSDMSTSQTEQVLLESFNVMMTLCCNWSNLSPYRLLLEQFFKQLEKSSMSDHFHKLLFQFTEDASEIRPMFQDTDDYIKHSFFANGCYLVQVKSSYSQQKQGVGLIETYKWLAKRVNARIFVSQQLQKAIKNLRKNKMIREMRPQLMNYGVDQEIMKINQSLPNLPGLLAQAQLLDLRLLQVQNYFISSQTQVSCYEIQLLLAKQAAYKEIQFELIQSLNSFVRNKWQILAEFADIGSVDIELRDAVDKAVTQMEVCDGEIVMWSILSDVRRRLKENDSVRSKRMQIKWKEWEDLSKRRQRLQQRIQKLKSQQ